jgi:thiol-disulfide isomerase/thioredoxin
MKLCVPIGLFCFVALMGLRGQDVRPAGKAGAVAPEFEFVTLSGEHVNSKNLRGKVIVIDFWSSDCNPCRKSMPKLEEFFRHYKDDSRVVVYLLNSGWETMEKARAFASSKRSGFLFFSWGTKYDLPFAYDSGSVTMKSIGFDSNPSTLVIDTHFRIRVKHSGYIQNIDEFLKEQVEHCLAEQ